MRPSSIAPTAPDGRSVARFVILLFGLCLPVWVIGAVFDIELFPGFKLFQAGLAMPMIASLLLTYSERRWTGIVALLRRTYDVGKLKPRIWLLPIFFVYPSIGLINYWILRKAGTDISSPTFSLVGFLGYCAVFFLTFGEELGLSGYAMDPLQERYSAL
jgi:membrane protease YdiL (CAAX protease family)